VPDELLVKVRPSLRGSSRDLLRAEGVDLLDEIPARGLHRVRVSPAAREAVRRALVRRPDVEFAEAHQLFPPAVVPNDPYFETQWHHATVDSASAWDRTRAVGQIVAILDSGVDATHPDLKPALLPGWDFWDGDSNPADVFGHGTRVAGVAAAVTHNGKGVAGVAWGAAILPVRVAGPNGYASSWSIAQGLEYAVARGAHVANLSFGQLAGSQTVLDAARSAVKDGMVVVASAGNCGCTEGYADTPWLLSVAATTASDALASYSSRGSFVDVAAPGQSVRTTTAGGGYAYASGTSFSAPLVAGLVALVRAADPTLTPAQVEARLAGSAVDLGAAGWDPSFGHGRVDARAVLSFTGCGLGFELALLLPPLMALRRRRPPRPRAETARESQRTRGLCTERAAPL